VKLHLEKSQSQKRNSSLLTIITKHEYFDEHDKEYSVVRCPIDRIFENPSFTVFNDSHSHHLNFKDFQGGSFIAGSCNGLILLVDGVFKHWLRVWNPATRTSSEKFGYCYHRRGDFRFAFGYDNSTGTYKVVALFKRLKTTEVRILNLGGDLVWRNIESFPFAPLSLDVGGDYVYLSGTLNWLAIHNNHSVADLWDNFEDITIEQYIIVSLDLETETYHQYTVPLGFAEVPPNVPVIAVLRGCLCFSYANKETDFVIWQMKEFGIEDSWTQLLKISYHDLLIDYDFSFDGGTMFCFQLAPLFLSEDGDTLVLQSDLESQTILYNRRDNRTKQTKIIGSRTTADNRTSDYDVVYLDEAKDYVESLVPIF